MAVEDTFKLSFRKGCIGTDVGYFSSAVRLQHTVNGVHKVVVYTLCVQSFNEQLFCGGGFPFKVGNVKEDRVKL